MATVLEDVAWALRTAGGEMTPAEVRVCINGERGRVYAQHEIEAALETLVAGGSVVKHGGRYRWAG